MNALRQRLPAPRQDQAARQARKNGGAEGGKAGYEPSRIAQLAQEAPIWYRSAARRRLYFLLFPAAVVSYATSGYDGSMMNSLQTVSYWDDFFDNPRGAQLGLMSAIMSLGSICSTPIAPWVADKYGRRMGITVGSLIMIIGAILQCESHNFGIWFVGSIAAAWITYGTRNIQSTCEEAMEALKQYHGEGGETELVRLEFEEIRAAIDHEKRSGTTTWPSMVRTKGNRYRMFLVVCMGFMSQWSGNGLVAYCEPVARHGHGRHHRQKHPGSGQRTHQHLELWPRPDDGLLRRAHRPPALFRASTLGMLTVFTAWTIASALFDQSRAKSAGIAVMALIFVFQFFYCIAFSPLPVAYSVEVLPYSIRAKGMATYVFSTKAAVFFNQFINPIGLENIGWRFYLVYVAILAVESFIAYGWFLETKGKALEEIAVIFDGEAADVRMDDGHKLEGLVDVEETENVHRKV
ncbi:lactose permease [Verticillium alfalfae VaMs.102]|uniref:Lactose permease n=1 Tax=Verticillium alfalfae (strain VaMs.102 / ATCC MYA-4576 / FGSC 10136) TaxID=526221 RepID=C9SG38_VERA1|nr:lactose permease [Verticillium alfalfae VaMs.102]EEY17442.1 lactose permease [Verticillium alfalfae VaMs.102]